MKIRKDLIIAIVATFCLTATMLNTRAWIYMGGMDFMGGGTLAADTDSSVWRCERASLWITASSFEQWNEGYFDYYMSGGGFLSQGPFYAQVQLPDGVIVKNMTCIGFSGNYNVSVVAMEVNLYGMNMSEFEGLLYLNLHMAQAANWHINATAFGSVLTGFDDTIDYNKIDNEHCIYWVHVYMYSFGWSQESLVGVRIDYEYPY